VDLHPDTHFIPMHEVEAMKHIVEQAQPSGGIKSCPSLPDDTWTTARRCCCSAEHIAKANNAIFADTA